MNEQHVLNMIGWAMVARVEEVEFFGSRWYDEAYNVSSWLSFRHRVSVDITTAVIAVLSPGCTWIKNLIDADNIMIDQKVKVSTYGRNKQKAIDILNYLDTSIVSGQKVSSFYHNILHRDSQEVTIDRHTVRTILQKPGEHPMTEDVYQRAISTPKRYRECSEVVRQAAWTWGVRAPQMQALTWCAYRRNNGQDQYDWKALESNRYHPVIQRWVQLLDRYS